MWILALNSHEFNTCISSSNQQCMKRCTKIHTFLRTDPSNSIHVEIISWLHLPLHCYQSHPEQQCWYNNISLYWCNKSNTNRYVRMKWSRCKQNNWKSNVILFLQTNLIQSNEKTHTYYKNAPCFLEKCA